MIKPGFLIVGHRQTGPDKTEVSLLGLMRLLRGKSLKYEIEILESTYNAIKLKKSDNHNDGKVHSSLMAL